MSVTVKGTLSATERVTAKCGQNGYSGRDSIGAFGVPSPNDGNRTIVGRVFLIIHVATQIFWSKVQLLALVCRGKQIGAAHAQVVNFCLDGGIVGVGGV